MNKVINVALNKEAKAAIEISKITGLGNEFDGNINWPLFFQYLISNRMLSLFWKNSNHMLIKQAMPKYISTVARSMYISTKYRNEIYFSELNKILQLCKENQITCVPVKGARLIPLLYKDYGSRFMGDVDCLISQESFSAINDIMISLGYIQGKFDKDLQKIIPINRAEKLKWKLNMSNYYPYLKECDSEHMRIIKIDFRYSLDDTLSTSSMKEIIDHVFKAGEMKKAHTLVHLCTHLYDESKHSMSLYIGKDVNLIKYDVLPDSKEFLVKIRYKDSGAVAKCDVIDNKLIINFYEPRSSVATGQSVVLYENNELVGGGIIESLII